MSLVKLAHLPHKTYDYILKRYGQRALSESFDYSKSLNHLPIGKRTALTLSRIKDKFEPLAQIKAASPLPPVVAKAAVSPVQKPLFELDNYGFIKDKK